MTIHNTLTGNELHEPKGMSSATAGAGDVGKLPVSKGDGTTEVRKLLSTEVDSTGATNRQIAVADGAGGVVHKTPSRMAWSN